MFDQWTLQETTELGLVLIYKMWRPRSYYNTNMETKKFLADKSLHT